MSQLIQMRQRMKAVETIKKITHAMRLISMSAHTRLRSKKEALANYKSEVLQLFGSIQPHFPNWHHKKLFAKENKKSEIALFILVGSQKGLCGTFNTNLFSYFEKNAYSKQSNTHIITVGKKASDYLQEKHDSVIMRFSEFSSITLPDIVDQIIDYILRPTSDYSHVVILSNYAKNFFIQYPTTTQLIPFTIPKTTFVGSSESYIWEQSPYEVLTNIAETLLQITLYDTLLESLVAEQAARFIAMDNSTRNASNLLDAMHLEYNKTRQAKITRELTDLVSSFQ
jgi:F-type H+-transporting ATPase subunit gamma